jgi:hypothetical protein
MEIIHFFVLCVVLLCKLTSVLSRTEKGHGIFFLKGHFARRIYQKGQIEKIG